jgi:nicotinate-nucleotide pyrophosphorylase (carboxylating)
LRLQHEAEQANKIPEELGSAAESSSQPTPMSSSHGDDSIYSEHAIIPAVESLHLLEGQPSASTTLSFEINDDRLLELFYEYFWPAFPVVIPLQFFQSRRMTAGHGLVDLSLVLEWIGSIYASWCPSEPYYQAALEAMSSPLLPRTPFTVQALMLFAIAQHHQDMRPESRKTLDHAILIALELDMNKRDFARVYGEGNPVLEESWRRTWYILSVTDQHLAIVMNSPIYQLANMPSDVDLPCDDEFFEAGVSLWASNTHALTDDTANTNACEAPGFG